MAYLERHNVVALFLAREIHVAELSPSERLSDVEVRELPALDIASSLHLALVLLRGCGLRRRIVGRG